MNKIKALFFVNSFAGGGAEKVCLNLAKQLYEFHIKSDFITVYDHRPDYDVPDYIRVFSLGIQDKALASVQIMKWIPKVNKFLADKEYVLITSHLPTSHFLASLTNVRKKALYVMHGSQHLIDKKKSGIYRHGLRLFLKGKKIITVSQGLADELKNEYKICHKNITTIYNPYCVESLSPGVTHTHNRAYILVMGRLEEEKNPLSALDLYYKGNFYEEYDLVYIGKGTLETSLKRKIENYRIQKYVFLMGFQKNPEQWLRNASLLLSCSRWEGLPMNLVEALYYQTPVVASDCPYGSKEIMIGELRKYLIYPEKTCRSISIISSALKSYPEIKEEYCRRFHSEQIVKRYLDVWKRNFGR